MKQKNIVLIELVLISGQYLLNWNLEDYITLNHHCIQYAI